MLRERIIKFFFSYLENKETIIRGPSCYKCGIGEAFRLTIPGQAEWGALDSRRKRRSG